MAGRKPGGKNKPDRDKTDKVEQMSCDLKWLHTEHSWSDNGNQYWCPGIYHQ